MREAARPLRRMSSTTQDSSEDQIWVAICILLRSFYENQSINLVVMPVLDPICFSHGYRIAKTNSRPKSSRYGEVKIATRYYGDGRNA